jgi:nucleoside-triphosphatase THEP1
MHDSAERCDAPKCHPETRVAVQDELVNWIEHGDEEEEPKRIVWVTGPAGGGKTAIMGSTADTCQKKGLLACGFFFSSFAASANRRLKRCLVATLAYQIVQHDALREVGDRILSYVERNPAIFERQLEVQLDQLLLQPLREIRRDAQSPKVILIDGLDECQTEQYGDIARSPQDVVRANEADQKEILHALLKAANDPSFPFRIIIASRPEPTIQSFFIHTAHHTTKRIFLDNKYNPDADMLLFLEAKFAEIRREYKLSSSWPSEDVKQTLVGNASGQFVYVATVMRFIGGSSAPPDKLLGQVLELRVSDVSANPFAPLDALYTHILSSCPDPHLTVRWLTLIFIFRIFYNSSASFVRLFLESSPGEASYVLRGLNSLVFIPPTDDHTSPYSLFHKSLTDFLGAPSRCGSLFLEEGPMDLYCTRYLQIWKGTSFFSISTDSSGFIPLTT